MKKVKIKYNPYLLETEIEIDGKKPKPNSKLNFGNLRIQEWSTRLPQILIDEASDKNFDIEFTGTDTDYNDFKTAIQDSGKITASIHTNLQPSVNEVENEIDKIFKKIQEEAPIESLKDESILEAFKKAKNQEFEINVVATMSSGKSTLINALIDKKLMPVANGATTATIVRIIDTPMPEEFDSNGNKLKRFDAIAYDANGVKIKEQKNITYEIMQEWNNDNSISEVDIYGEIPCGSETGMKLILVDTPGPNNSQDDRHRTMTYKMLEDSDKSLVLFVLNGRQLHIEDQKNFLDYVCKCMNEGGKQSRERYIFAVNQMDAYNPEDENIDKELNKLKKILEDYKVDKKDYKILSPNLFPVSAAVALQKRTNPKIKTELNGFRDLVQMFPEMKLDEYYSYNNLPMTSKNRIEKLLKECENEDAKIEIHSGIVSIEEAIRLYIDKYARALKVKDLVDSFNNRLKELNSIAELQKEVRNSQDKKDKLDKEIEKIQNKINSGNSAKELSSIIEDQNLSTTVNEDIDEFVKINSKNIDKIIFSYKNKNKVLRSEAEGQIKKVRTESEEIIAQLDSRINTILEKGYKLMYETILHNYRKYIEQLGVNVGENIFYLHPLDFIAENLYNLDKLIDGNIKIVDEGHFETKYRDGKKKTNWFWNPKTWFTKRYEQEAYEKWIPKNVEYVDMEKVIEQYLQPLQKQLYVAKDAALSHAEIESKRVKSTLQENLSNINKTLDNKLQELKVATDLKDLTEKEIERQEQNLLWMQDVIARVNKLINY